MEYKEKMEKIQQDFDKLSFLEIIGKYTQVKIAQALAPYLGQIKSLNKKIEEFEQSSKKLKSYPRFKISGPADILSNAESLIQQGLGLIEKNISAEEQLKMFIQTYCHHLAEDLVDLKNIEEMLLKKIVEFEKQINNN